MQQIRTMSPLKSLKRQMSPPRQKLQFTADIKQIKQQQLDYAGIHQKSLQGLQAQYQKQRQEASNLNDENHGQKQSLMLSQLDNLHGSGAQSPNWQSTDGKDYRMLYKELQEQLEKYLIDIHLCKEKLYDNDTKLQAYSTFLDDLVIAVRLDQKMRQNQHTMLFNPIIDRIMDIHKDNIELREQVKKQQVQLDEQSQQFTIYNQKIQDLKDQYHKFRQQTFVAKQQQEQVQRELNSNIILKEDITLKKKIQMQQQQIDELQTKIERLQEELVQSQKQIDQMQGLQAENQVLTVKIQELLGTDNNKQYIEGLVKEISQQQKIINQQNEKIDQMNKQIKMQQIENENAKEQLVIYQQESYKQDSEIKRLKKEEEMFMQQLSVSRSSLKLKQEEMEEIQNKQNQVIDKVKEKYEQKIVDAMNKCEKEKRVEKEEQLEIINGLKDDRVALFKKLFAQTHNYQIAEIKDIYMKLEEAVGQIYRQIDEMSAKQEKQQEQLNITIQTEQLQNA